MQICSQCVVMWYPIIAIIKRNVRRLTIRNLIKLIHVSWSITFVSNFDKDYYNATHIALQCILHGWSVASLKHLDTVYVFTYVFHVCFMSLHIVLFFVICISCVLHMYSYMFYILSATLQWETLYVLIYVVQKHMKYWCIYEDMNSDIYLRCLYDISVVFV